MGERSVKTALARLAGETLEAAAERGDWRIEDVALDIVRLAWGDPGLIYTQFGGTHDVREPYTGAIKGRGASQLEAATAALEAAKRDPGVGWTRSADGQPDAEPESEGRDEPLPDDSGAMEITRGGITITHNGEIVENDLVIVFLLADEKHAPAVWVDQPPPAEGDVVRGDAIGLDKDGDRDAGTPAAGEE